jgi:hypothetical protein
VTRSVEVSTRLFQQACTVPFATKLNDKTERVGCGKQAAGRAEHGKVQSVMPGILLLRSQTVRIDQHAAVPLLFQSPVREVL